MDIALKNLGQKVSFTITGFPVIVFSRCLKKTMALSAEKSVLLKPKRGVMSTYRHCLAKENL
jgi:hypothetical protein